MGAFWFFATRSFHPTTGLAVVVTTSLICAYALASYVNHLVLIPKYFRIGHYGQYVVALFVAMVVLNGLALAVIRIVYQRTVGPDADPNGAYVHFAIDFFGMVVHVVAASGVVAAYDYLRRRK